MHFVTAFWEEEEESMKKLNGKDLFFMAMGSCIGAGIITNTGVAIGMAGSGVILAYLLAFFVMFIANLPTMLFATVHPVIEPSICHDLLGQQKGGRLLALLPGVRHICTGLHGRGFRHLCKQHYSCHQCTGGRLFLLSPCFSC